MEEHNSKQFAETIFSYRWRWYLDEFGIETIPGEWFYKTISQAYTAFSETDQSLLKTVLINPLKYNERPEKKHIPKPLLYLYEEAIEPYFLQKLSVFTAREILGKCIDKIKERENAFNGYDVEKYSSPSTLQQSSEAAVTETTFETTAKTKQTNSIIDDSIIDISAEGQSITFTDEFIGASDNSSGIVDASGYDDSWKLGNKYKQKLSLTEEEVTLLNKFWDPSNSFLSAEQCCLEVIKLYLLCLKDLAFRFQENKNDFFSQVDRFISQNLSRIGNFHSIEQGHQYCERNIYLTFFKRAESAVRDAFNHKRKINDAFNLNEIAGSFERRFGSFWNEMIAVNKSRISPPDAETELLLNEMNVNRWKIFFDEITSGITGANYQECAAKIDELAIQNAKNPALENIYYEASKLFVKQDKLTAVKFYLKYIHADLNSDKVDSRQLGKTIQKSLFATEEQLKDFETVANNLIKTNDLASALSKASEIYAMKRKRIHLDMKSIEQIKIQHESTVGKLNDLLHDEEEVFSGKPHTATEEVELKLIQPIIKPITISTNSFLVCVQLNDNQKGLLFLFGENNFQLRDEMLSSYAKSKNLFKNQLVESINDSCYEELDDLLIEESGDVYEANEFYYNKIINLCQPV